MAELMNSERWEKIGIIFDEALNLSEPERSEFIKSACGDDIEMQNEVKSLIEADSKVPPVLKAQAGDAVNIRSQIIYEGKIIGNYKVIKQIAEGGMGSVFLAERADGQFEQKVALKIIKPGMNSNEIIKRFLSERQILARLQHPNIAKLLDGGLTEDNLPYFTMEYVEGEPISEYCDKNNLSVEERLKIFITVCSAIQYAHHNLVIHRDIKPSNIMIKKDGTVKLLDFGIAKVLSEDTLNEDVNLTQTGLHVMTPEYASPEQIKGKHVTTSTDIYSLGIVLYELLTGEKVHNIKNYSPLEMEKAICLTQPQKPSSLIKQVQTKDKSKADEISIKRNTLPEKLKKKLAGDLDNICLTALRKEPETRYSSVELFRQDIENFLEERPVTARQSTINYRMKKFVLRHKVAVVFGLLIFLIVTSLTTFYTIQLKHERDAAQAEAVKANEVSGFLKNIFKVSDPYNARGDTITARELLDKGAEKINRSLSNQPEVKAELLDLIGQVYLNMGIYNKADSLIKIGLTIREKYDKKGTDIEKSLNSLSNVYLFKGEYAKAAALLNRVVLLHKSLSQEDDTTYTTTLSNLAWSFYATGKYLKSDSIYIVLINILTKKYGMKNELMLSMMNNLALNYHEEGKYKESDSLFQIALNQEKIVYGNKPHPELSTTLYNYAELLRDKGNFPKAEEMFKSALAMDLKLHGPVNPDVAYSTQGLASFYLAEGHYSEANKLFRRTLEIREKLLGKNHPDVAYAIYNVGLVYFDEQKYDSSKTYFEKSLIMHKKLNGPEHKSVGICLNMLGFVNCKVGNYKVAESQTRQSMKIIEKSIGKVNLTYARDLITLSVLKSQKKDFDSVIVLNQEAQRIAEEAMNMKKSPFISWCLNIFAKTAMEEGNYKKADSLYILSLNMHKQIMGENIGSTISTALDYSNLLVKLDSLIKAEKIVNKNFAILRNNFKEDNWITIKAKVILAEIYFKKKLYANTENLLLNAYYTYKKIFGLKDYHTKETAQKLTDFYNALGKKAKAYAFRNIMR
jgi:eukaryotic-like serine/threonine-protein kinase